MLRSTLAAVVTTLSVSATPVAAATIADVYSSFWVFGDSLSDNGNVSAALAAAPVPVDFPPAPYFDGRFSNGPVWNERFLADFLPGRSANFAFGGARTSDNGDTIPDLDDQVVAFTAARPFLTLGSRSLASVFFGANDVFDAINAAAVSAPGDIFGILSGRTAATLGNIAAGVGALSAQGIHEFALWNLPDLGQTPRLSDLGPQAQALGSLATAIYNAGFDAMVGNLRNLGLTIHTVDTFGLFMAATGNPSTFGLVNLTEACLPVDPFQILQGVPVPAACAAPDTFLYWDKLHPTRVGHDALAAAFDASVPAIPLPASALMLLGGLGAFAGFRRRAA
jgi:phospholipase/lecithinase/hemolysin